MIEKRVSVHLRIHLFANSLQLVVQRLPVRAGKNLDETDGTAEVVKRLPIVLVILDRKKSLVHLHDRSMGVLDNGRDGIFFSIKIQPVPERKILFPGEGFRHNDIRRRGQHIGASFHKSIVGEQIEELTINGPAP